MRVELRSGRKAHLTYCANVHAAESADDVIAVVKGPMRRVFGRLAGLAAPTPLAAGLRFSAAAAFAFRDDAFLVEELGDALLAADAHALTVNAFVYGDFHGKPVKRAVYRPDWTTDERVAFTVATAEVLAALPALASTQSISTSPGSFKAFGPANDLAMAERFARVAAELHMLEMQFDRRIVLAVEPEPGCSFETIDEWIRFYEEVLLRGAWPALEKLKPGNRAAQETILRAHLTTCFDVCHAAVEFEDVAAAFRRLAARGIAVGKIQLSNALRLGAVAPGSSVLERLRDFSDAVYLHQTVAKDDAGGLHAFEDLPDFLAAAERRPFAAARVHFHVPLFFDGRDGLLSTTPDLALALESIADLPDESHLEIETYTWNVLPAKERSISIEDGIVAEYAWARARIAERT